MKPLDYFYDNPSSGVGHFPQRFCKFFFFLVRVVFGIAFRYQLADKQVVSELPPGQGAIIVGNHRSYLDPVLVMAAFRPRPIRFMAKAEFFAVHPIVARATAYLGAFPVNRGSADMVTIKRAVRMLKRGEVIGIYPEGHRQRLPGQPVVHHEGIAMISALANVPVIPMRIWGTDRIKPAGKKMFRLPKVSMRMGQPININDEPFASMPKKERNTAFTEEVMRRVYELKPLPGTVDAKREMASLTNTEGEA